MTQPDKNLFIVSDDLGLHPSVNEGIALALKEGWIDGASLMANGEYFEDALERLKEIEKPNLGVHFVLVEEKPLAISRLWEDHKIFFIKYILRLINMADIEKEMRAQLGRCITNDIKLRFLNSHQHLHLLPKITDITIKLAKENNIEYIRTVTEPLSLKGGLFRAVEAVFLSFLSKIARSKIKKAGLKSNDFFVGFLRAGKMQESDIFQAKQTAQNYGDKSVELGCHIGYESGELKEKYEHWGGYNWQRELEILKINT